MEFKSILLNQDNNTLIITINRESKLNALNKATLDELNLAITNAQKNQEIRAIIITGAGAKSFVAGADIAEFKDLTVDNGKDFAREGQTKVFDIIANSNKPFIAAVNGYALGGGLELALACHLRIASDNAQLGFPELKLGLIPCYGGTQRLTELVGKGKAMEMILTSDKINAKEALEIGLINYLVSPEDLLNKALEITKKISKNPPLAIGSAIKAINSYNDVTVNGYELEMAEFELCVQNKEFHEGVNAFLEKREPKF
jgi:enoyl-CoA hydratase